MTTTGIPVQRLLGGAEQLLAHVESARLDAELLLASVTGRRREWFYAHPEAEIAAHHAGDYRRLVEQRRSGYPVAYLVGYREFWSLRLVVDRHTLIPRPETETVVQAALDLIDDRGTQAVLDLGTGSGAIGIAVAHERPACRVTAVDISREALRVAAANAARIELRNIEFAESDWFAGLARRRFDLVLCNPPYVDSHDPLLSAGENRFEPRIALDGGHEGLEAIAQVVAGAAARLNPGGAIVIEHGATQGDAVRRLLLHHGFRNISTARDLAGHERVTRGSLP